MNNNQDNRIEEFVCDKCGMKLKVNYKTERKRRYDILLGTMVRERENDCPVNLALGSWSLCYNCVQELKSWMEKRDNDDEIQDKKDQENIYMSIYDVVESGVIGMTQTALRRLIAQGVIPGFYSGVKFYINVPMLKSMIEDPNSKLNSGVLS